MGCMQSGDAIQARPLEKNEPQLIAQKMKSDVCGCLRNKV